MSFDPASVVRDYGDPFGEAVACRRSAAVFDYSFVARGRISGPDALAVLARLTPRRLDDMQPGQIRYAVRESPAGHLVADLTVWRHADGAFEVMSGRRQDIADLVALAPSGAAADHSDEAAILAVQGPGSLVVLARAGIAAPALGRLPYYRFCSARLDGADCLVGRLGYTGEAGFEIVAPRAVAGALWAGLARHARPAGFAAADILRIEAGFLLFANEFRLPVTAGEAGLPDFHRASSVPAADPLALVAFTARAAERPALWQPHGRPAPPSAPGEIAVTSACWSPHASRVLGLGYVRARDLEAAVPLLDPTATFADIARAPRPFVDPLKLRPRAPWLQSPP